MAVSTEREASELVPERAGWWLALAGSCLVFVLAAVVLETLSGLYANSPVPGWAELVPLAWPKPARVVWWLLVGAASGGFRLGLHRLGIRQRPVIVVASVVPFVAFAAGIALDSSWSTWH